MQNSRRSPVMKPKEITVSLSPASVTLQASPRFGTRKNREALLDALMAAFSEKTLLGDSPDAKSMAFAELWKQIDDQVNPAGTRNMPALKESVKSNFAAITNNFLGTSPLAKGLKDNVRLMLAEVGVLYRMAYMLDMMTSSNQLLSESCRALDYVKVTQSSVLLTTASEAELKIKEIRQSVEEYQRRAVTAASAYDTELRRELKSDKRRLLKTTPDEFQSQCGDVMDSLVERYEQLQREKTAFEKELQNSTEEKELKDKRDGIISALTALHGEITQARLPALTLANKLFLHPARLPSADISHNLETFSEQCRELSEEYASLDKQFCETVEKITFPVKESELFQSLFDYAEAREDYDRICASIQRHQPLIGTSDVWQAVSKMTTQFFRAYQECGGLKAQGKIQYDIGVNLRDMRKAAMAIKTRIDSFSESIISLCTESGLADVQDGKKQEKSKEAEKTPSKLAAALRNIFPAKFIGSEDKSAADEKQAELKEQQTEEQVLQSRQENIKSINEQISRKLQVTHTSFELQKRQIEENIEKQFVAIKERYEAQKKQILLNIEREVAALQEIDDKLIAKKVADKIAEQEAERQRQEAAQRRQAAAALKSQQDREELQRALVVGRTSPHSSPVLQAVRTPRKESSSDLREPLLASAAEKMPSEQVTSYHLPFWKRWAGGSVGSGVGFAALTVAAVTLIASNPAGWVVGGALMLAAGVALLGAAIVCGAKALNRYRKRKVLEQHEDSALQQTLDSQNDVLKDKAQKRQITISRDTRYFMMQEGITISETPDAEVSEKSGRETALQCDVASEASAPLYFDGKTGQLFFHQVRENRSTHHAAVKLDQPIKDQLARFKV